VPIVSPAPVDTPSRRTYVLDTSVLLSDPRAVLRFDEHDVVIPVVVVTFIALLELARESLTLLLDPNKDAFGRTKSGLPNRPVAAELVSRSDGAIKLRWYRTHGEQFHAKLVMVSSGERSWLTLGSANLTRRNVGDYNLEANLAVEAASSTALVQELERWFETLWSNRAPAGIEYSADFGTFADPAQSSYWAYRIMEATGLSTF